MCFPIESGGGYIFLTLTAVNVKLNENLQATLTSVNVGR
jgi:hypothetical protein